jgi:hypothetical protein
MKIYGRIAVLVLVILTVGSTVAIAVGYEPVKAMEPSITDTKAWARGDLNVWRALKQASMVEKYPALLDKAALTVKTFLGQFGVTDVKAP